MGVSQKTIPMSFMRFDGGLNTRFSTLSLDENEVYDIENFHLEARGGIEKRAGYAYLFGDDTSTGDPINGLYFFKPTEAVVRIEGGVMSTRERAAGSWSDRSAALVFSVDPDDLWNFATFKETLFGVNGVNQMVLWTGSGNATAAATAIGATGDSITTAAVCIMHRERIILGNVTTDEGGSTNYGSRLWPSAMGSLDTWHSSFTDGKIVDVDEGDGDTITALADAQGMLVVFKQNSLHRINDFGLPGVSQRIKIANVGTPGPHMVRVVGNYVFFYDIVGQLWVYDARGTNQDNVVNLSERKIGKTTLDGINKTRLAQGHMWHDPVRNEHRAWMTTFGGTTTDVTQTFNMTSAGFARLVYTDPMNISANYIDSDGDVRCIVGTNGGGVFLLDVGTQDNEVDYTAYVVTRWLDFGDMSVIKGTRFFHLYGSVTDTQALTLEHRTQLQPAGGTQQITLNGPGARLDEFVLDEDFLGGSGDSLAKARVESYARWHQFKITQAVDMDLRIIGFVLMVVTAGRDRDGT